MNSYTAEVPENIFKFNYLDASMHASSLSQMLVQAGMDIAPYVGMNERILADRLDGNAKQNMSAIGNGIAIMNLRVSGLAAPFQALIRLKKAIAVDTPDGRNIDLYGLVLTPERDGNSYLRMLARMSRLLRDKDIQARLRNAQDEDAMRLVLEQTDILKAAA